MKNLFSSLLILCCFFAPVPTSAETGTAKIYRSEYTGYLQYPAPGEDDLTMLLWKNPLKMVGPNRWTKIIFEEGVLDSLGYIGDLQHREITLKGLFQKFPDGKIVCIDLGASGFGLSEEELLKEEIEVLKEKAAYADSMLTKLAFRGEGYVEYFDGIRQVALYNHPTEEGTEQEIIDFDEKTLFIGLPRERLKIWSPRQKVRVSVGWRKQDPGDLESKWIADYINISAVKE